MTKVLVLAMYALIIICYSNSVSAQGHTGSPLFELLQHDYSLLKLVDRTDQNTSKKQDSRVTHDKIAEIAALALWRK